MRLPNRKPGKYANQKIDPNITRVKFNELKIKLEKLKKIVRPRLSKEVQQLSLNGDFSENAEYQIAKGKLRGVNRKILEIENLLNHARVIETNKNIEVVELGHYVTIKRADKTKIYQILGSAENDPAGGVISHNSPLGSALIGKRVGDIVKIKAGENTVEWKVVKIR